MGLFSWFTGESKVTDFSKPNETNLNESLVGNPTAVIGEIGNPSFGLGEITGLEGNFIGDSFYDTGGVFGRPFGNPGFLEVEKSYIMHQRAISLYPEVAIGIEEIMRDLFTKDDPLTLVTAGDEENKEFGNIKELFDLFRKKPFTILSNTKTPDPLIVFNFLKQAYIDGRICVLSLLIDEDKLTSKSTNPPMHGMKGTYLNESLVHWRNDVKFIDVNKLSESDIVSLLESSNEVKTKAKRRNKTSKETESNSKKLRIFVPIDPVKVNEQNGELYYNTSRANKIKLADDQLIQSDFGLFDVTGARHGFLLYAFKYANQLQSLQDMLIPMRFRRSVARRVFNVDISQLPQNRATAYMQDLQNKFKYKKHYDATSGKIVSKVNEPTGIVEDYWFANRSGSKGTTVETIDEAGNFQDSLDDIMYFNKKLYQSMFIPLRRIFESDASYDYTANSIEVDELRFVNFLERVRFVFNNVLTEMFKQILKDNHVDEEVIHDVSIELNYNAWYERAKIQEDFEKSMDLYETAKPLIGKLLSAETVIDKCFNLSSSDIANEFEKIKSEIEEDNVYYPIYQANQEPQDDY